MSLGLGDDNLEICCRTTQDVQTETQVIPVHNKFRAIPLEPGFKLLDFGWAKMKRITQKEFGKHANCGKEGHRLQPTETK